MNSERRLTIVIVGFTTVVALAGIVVLSAMGKPLPAELSGVVLLGLGILTPSPLSKTAVPTDVSPRKGASA